jgi:hypothetical protein
LGPSSTEGAESAAQPRFSHGHHEICSTSESTMGFLVLISESVAIEPPSRRMQGVVQLLEQKPLLDPHAGEQ